MASLLTPLLRRLHQLSHLGVDPHDFQIDSRRTVVCNQLAWASLLISFPFFWLNLNNLPTTLTLLSLWALMIGVMWLNSRELFRAARLTYVLTVLHLFYWLGILFPTPFPELKSGYQHLQMAFSTFSLVLFSFRRDRLTVSLLLLYGAAQVILFPVLDQAITLFPPAGNSYDKIVVQNDMMTAVAILILGLAFGFYQRMSRRAETAAEALLEESQLQHRKLADKEQQIKSTLHELQQTNTTIYDTIQEREQQQARLEQQHDAIVASLTYARRIQKAILPPLKQIRGYFPHSFVYYRPRYLVSGDFYWLYETSGRVHVAVVDCTGHGVPGAFMSVMAYSLMNQILGENPHLLPDEVCRLLDEQVRTSLRQKDARNEIDGLDLILCCFDRHSRKLYFSGARRPLLRMRQGQLEKWEMPDTALGSQGSDQRAYPLQETDLLPADRFFLYTEGILKCIPDADKDAAFRFWLTQANSRTLGEQAIDFAGQMRHWLGSNVPADDCTLLAIEWSGPRAEK